MTIYKTLIDNLPTLPYDFYQMFIYQMTIYQMTILPNDYFTKWLFYQMTILPNDYFIKWLFYQMTSCQMTIHQYVDVMSWNRPTLLKSLFS